MIRCLITDGTCSREPRRWLAHVARWVAAGVELVQIRERDLTARSLADLTRAVVAMPRGDGTKILVNDRADVAMACGADGVHLRDRSVAPAKFARSGFLVTVSSHSVADAAGIVGADYLLLAPIFKPLSKAEPGPALGLYAIREVTRHSRTPVLALGGITHKNAPACREAGAAGIAGISLFGDDPR